MKIKVIIIAIIVAVIVMFEIYTSTNKHDYTVTVTEKERVVDGDSSKYLIYCKEDDGNIIVFENTDSLLNGKFDSSNVYAKIKEGNTYQFTVVGFRIPFLSCYENIVEIEERD